MKVKRHYMLMISCPGDVVRERDLLKKCVERINAEREDDIWVELRYWVTDTFSDASMPAQDSINQQIVNDSDGLIAIFNARLGTPVHGYKCGTDEEISLMLSAHKHVSLLFNNKPIIDLTKGDLIEQLKALIEYKKENNTKAYYRTFESEESFSELAMQEIRLWLKSFPKVAPQNNVSSQGDMAEQKTEQVIHEHAPAESPSQDDGIIDVIVDFSNIANEMTEKVNEYGNRIETFGRETEAFTEQYTYLANAGKASALQAACMSFANKMIALNNDTSSFNVYFSDKWNSINKKLIVIEKNALNKEDRMIFAGNIEKLKSSFAETSESFSGFEKSLESAPNIQRDFNRARVQLQKSIGETHSILRNAVSDCENLIIKYAG